MKIAVAECQWLFLILQRSESAAGITESVQRYPANMSSASHLNRQAINFPARCSHLPK
jgi:hypothetical protein